MYARSALGSLSIAVCQMQIMFSSMRGVPMMWTSFISPWCAISSSECHHLVVIESGQFFKSALDPLADRHITIDGSCGLAMVIRLPFLNCSQPLMASLRLSEIERLPR